jgi:hypothetical protein
MIPRTTPTERSSPGIMDALVVQSALRSSLDVPIYERIHVCESYTCSVPYIARNLRLIAVAEFVEGAGFDDGDLVGGDCGKPVS